MLATCQFIREKVCILLVGQTGTGKTHVTQAIGHCALRKLYDVIFLTPTELFQQMQAARAKGDYQKKYKSMINAPLLIIDDFALKPMKVQQEEDLHDVIAGRYERCATIITSNLDSDEWASVFANRVLGSAIIDRVKHGAYDLILTGKSYRTSGQRENNKENNKEVEPT